MAFSPAFTVAQTSLNAALVILTDVSTGSDGSIASRRVTVINSQGSYVVPVGNSGNTIAWPLATNPLTLDLLTGDISCNILVEWLDGAGITLYDSENVYCLAQFNKNFLYYLIQQQSQNYPVIYDQNYWANVALLWTNIVGAIQAIEIGADLQASQACLSRASYLSSNQNLYF